MNDDAAWAETPPAQPLPLATAVRWIAQLGGYLNRRGDDPPGVTVLWKGFQPHFFWGDCVFLAPVLYLGNAEVWHDHLQLQMTMSLVSPKGEVYIRPLADPQLAAGLAAFEMAVPGGITLDDIPATRQFLEGLTAAMAAQAPNIPGVVISDHDAPGPDGAPDVMVRVYQPAVRPATLPALLWIHSGGYVLGSVQGDDLKAKGLALALNCVVASVEYRLAPEHPFPAPLEDCYAALKWLAASADQFGVNPARIAIGGRVLAVAWRQDLVCWRAIEERLASATNC